MGFHDFLISFQPENTLGWSSDSINSKVVILNQENWGELKKQIQEKRKDADVLVYLGGDGKLNRKAVEDSRVDVLLHPELGRQDSGLNHILAKAAAENNVAIGLDFSKLYNSERRDRVMSDWRKNIGLCDKYGAPYLISTNAVKKQELRAPRDLAALVTVLGGNGIDSVKSHPKKILKKSKQRNSDKFVRSGVEEVE